MIIKYQLYYKYPRFTNMIARRKMEPSFLLIGTQKSGTTALYDQLMELPVFQPASAKEIPDLSYGHCRVDLYKIKFPYKKKGLTTGNACHLDMYSPFGAINIKKHFPKAKLIVIMRDPVDRAYSHYKMDRKFNWIGDKVTFQDYVKFELSVLNKLDNIYNIEELYNNTRLFNAPFGMTVGKGVYHTFLKHFDELGLNYLPVCLEEYNSDFKNQFKKILDFLELDEGGEKFSEMKHSNKSIRKGEDSHEFDVVRNELIEFYQPHNEKLFKQLGTNYPWK